MWEPLKIVFYHPWKTNIVSTKTLAFQFRHLTPTRATTCPRASSSLQEYWFKKNMLLKVGLPRAESHFYRFNISSSRKDTDYYIIFCCFLNISLNSLLLIRTIENAAFWELAQNRSNRHAMGLCPVIDCDRLMMIKGCCVRGTLLHVSL